MVLQKEGKFWKNFSTKYPNVRHRKVEKAIMFALQRAKYFLAANVDDDLEETTSILENGTLKIFSRQNHDFYYHLFELDALIRVTDDIIDEDILTREKPDYKEIVDVVENFLKQFPKAKRVAELFYDELNFNVEQDKEEQKRLLMQVMKNRSSDIDLIIDEVLKEKGTVLNQKELTISRSLLDKWQIFESIITDLWYIKQDKVKNDFNIFLKATMKNLDLTFIKDNLKVLTKMMEKDFKKLSNHKCLAFIEKVCQNSTKLLHSVYFPLISDFEKDEETWYQTLISIKLL